MKLASFFARLARRDQASPVAAEDDLHIYRSTGSKPVVMVTVLGVKPQLLDEIVAVTRQKFEADHRLVYLTDSTDFAVFRRFSLAFEYLPAILEQQLHADAMAWPAYLKERWALLVAKWRPVHILAYGRNIDAFIAAAPPAQAARTPTP